MGQKLPFYVSASTVMNCEEETQEKRSRQKLAHERNEIRRFKRTLDIDTEFIVHGSHVYLLYGVFMYILSGHALVYIFLDYYSFLLFEAVHLSVETKRMAMYMGGLCVFVYVS